MVDSAASAVIREYIKAWPDDYETLGRLRTPDYVEDWPQSRERVRGDANYRAIHEAYPGGLPQSLVERVSGTPEQWAVSPMFTLVHLTGAGSTFTVEGTLRYPDGTEYKAIAVIGLKGDRVAWQRSYFAPITEAPAWREQWVERTTD